MESNDKKKKSAASKKKKTAKIHVAVNSNYVPAQSNPAHDKFVWSYEITITNDSDEIVQLLNRFWRITDMTSKIEEIHGAGVIGLQPLIKPGRQFTYVSYCQLMTPQGTMEGHYEFQNIDEERFTIEIPKFILCAPTTITSTFRSRLH